MQREESTILKWKCATLYEPRWHAVLGFVKHLAPLMQIFRVCWDAAKYRSGLDGDGVRAQANEGDGEGDSTAALDLELLTESVHCNFFNRYLHFSHRVDELPEKHIAVWGEACECHETLCAGLSRHMRSKLLEQHYGPNIHVCPAAGCRVPEIVDGALERVMATAWEFTEHEVFRGWVSIDGSLKGNSFYSSLNELRILTIRSAGSKFIAHEAMTFAPSDVIHHRQAIIERPER